MINKTAVLLAAREGDLPFIESATRKSKASLLSLRDDLDRGLLHRALHGKQDAICSFLLKEGFPVDNPDKDGKYPLMTALETQAPLDLIELILKRNAKPDRVHRNKTALHYAVYHSDPPGAIALLIKHGADVSFSDEAESLIQFACMHNNIPALEEFLRQGAHMDAMGPYPTPLHAGASQKECDIRMLKILVKHGCALETSKPHDEKPRFQFAMSPLSSAAFYKNYPVVEYLITELGMDPNSSDPPPIVEAERDPAMIMLLVNLGADPSPLLSRDARSYDIAKAALDAKELRAHAKAIRNRSLRDEGGFGL